MYLSRPSEMTCRRTLARTIMQGDTAGLVRQLQGGAGVSEADIHGWTPLHWACSRGSASMTYIILQEIQATRIGAGTESRGVNTRMYCHSPWNVSCLQLSLDKECLEWLGDQPTATCKSQTQNFDDLRNPTYPSIFNLQKVRQTRRTEKPARQMTV